MKILFLAHADSIHSHRWIRYFAEKNNEIHWISLVPSIDSVLPEMKNVSFYNMSGEFSIHSPLAIFNTVKKIKKILRQTGPDIFHVHYAGVNGFFASLCNYHPFIVTAWGSDVLIAGKHLLKRFLVSYILHTSDLITCDAEHMKKAIMNFGVPEQKIHIIQFGIDANRFAPWRSAKDMRSEMNILPDSNIVISLRNFEPIYDLGTLVRAMPLVLEKMPKTVFLLVGKGSERATLEALARELRVDHAVRFLGFIPNTELPDYLRASDLYVSTSLSDAGIASSTAEAMACEIPVVVTDSGENSLWVADGKHGYCVPIKDPPALAEKIIFLLERAELRKTMGYAARNVILERNDYWNEMKKMNTLYANFHQQHTQ